MINAITRFLEKSGFFLIPNLSTQSLLNLFQSSIFFYSLSQVLPLIYRNTLQIAGPTLNFQKQFLVKIFTNLIRLEVTFQTNIQLHFLLVGLWQ